MLQNVAKSHLISNYCQTILKNLARDVNELEIIEKC